ncbi:serine hydrolase domain-containing protein [Algoriphagus sp. PAP.12]|uniref:serine hydrolase domain-containing protein n=1 Tax=Algoriphagus sp. PAP.12 TaxID=2996678 RepID=UPI00227B5B1C|nr:serine hydrolase domain-containing protein [Algoriphagus sp. PAP.12]
MKKYNPLFVLAVLLLFSLESFAQSDAAWNQKIDSLFTEWNTPNHPGGAIAVMKDGKTIFSQAYGLASLEYLVPNSTGTIFNTGSVSKQFTAMGIVRLEEEGKLSFDDDIRKFIPELPDFGEKITIRHMLHHTSGLRSLHTLFGLAGWRDDDSRTNADLNRIILNQEDLNFSPGSEYLYCNTGYMLMVNIIENVTGEVFKEWMHKNIFSELNMSQTYVEDLYSRVVPNNATSYYGSDNFERAVEYWGYVGSGNMHSTTADLLTWLSNFSHPQKGWESSFQKMQTVDLLTDGSENNYAFGVIVDEHLGRKRIQHGGSIGGFRAYVATYPEEELSIVALTNFSAGNPGGHSNQIAEIILGKSNTEAAPKPAIKSISLNNEALAKFEGTYWDDKAKSMQKVQLKNDTLRYSGTGRERALVPISSNTFKLLNVPADVEVKFETAAKKDQLLVSVDGSGPSIFDEVENPEFKEEDLKDYVGEYYSSEVETTYTISVKDDKIELYQVRHGFIPAKVLFKDVITADYPTNVVQFVRDSKGKVTGILITNGRVRNAWFKKVL